MSEIRNQCVDQEGPKEAPMMVGVYVCQGDVASLKEGRERSGGEYTERVMCDSPDILVSYSLLQQ